MLLPHEVEQLNEQHNWKQKTLFTVETYLGKGEEIEIPDNTVKELNNVYPLRDKKVFEIECNEGCKSMSLMLYSAKVQPVDSSLENIKLANIRFRTYNYDCLARYCEIDDIIYFNEFHYDLVYSSHVIDKLLMGALPFHIKSCRKLADTMLLECSRGVSELDLLNEMFQEAGYKNIQTIFVDDTNVVLLLSV